MFPLGNTYAAPSTWPPEMDICRIHNMPFVACNKATKSGGQRLPNAQNYGTGVLLFLEIFATKPRV